MLLKGFFTSLMFFGGANKVECELPDVSVVYNHM